MKKIAVSLMLVCALVFGLSLNALYRNDQENKSAEAYFKALSEKMGLVAKAEELPVATRSMSAVGDSVVKPAVSLPPTEDPVLLAYREQAKAYPDLAGWIRIEGTTIDYPVMRSLEDAQRYLHLDFEGRTSRSGTPFMMPVSDPSVPNENIIIYAHHMKDGSMFGALPIYETKAAYDAQPYIQFDSLYERGLYKIIAVSHTTVEDTFRYYDHEWLDDQTSFDNYIREVMARRLYDTGETAVYGDRLITLSTCDYHKPDGRLIVVAKKVQEGE